LLQRCSALIVPGTEDFGMASLEAQAAGRPVIAYGAGGSLETVVEGVTGEFFREPSVEALAAVLRCFAPERYKITDCRAQAARFDIEQFKRRLWEHLHVVQATHQRTLAGE
jgi:glycosyltransferase involved in cell wall biosynthesis